MNRCFSILLAACILAVDGKVMAVDPYQSYQDNLAAKTTLVNNLATEFGYLIATKAAAAKAAITTNYNDLTTFIGTFSGSVPAELTSIQASLTTLMSVCDDYIIIGTLQGNIAAPLYQLGGIDISWPASGVAGTIAAQVSALSAAKTDYDTVYTLGLNGGTGSIVNSAQWTAFLADRALALLAFKSTSPLGIAQLMGSFATANTNLATALAAVPLPNDDTVIDYDTSYTTAQQAVIAAAQALISSINVALSGTLTTLISGDQSQSATQIDYRADAARLIQSKLQQFSANAQAIINKATLGMSDIALRVFQRERLFNITTIAQQQSLNSSILSGTTGNSTAASNLQSAVATIGGLLSVSPPSFNCGPVTTSTSPSVALAAMQAEVDAQVDTYVNSLTTTMRGLFASPPNQDAINAAIETVKPAIYLQMVSNVMSSWLAQRSNDLSSSDTINLADATVSKYVAEWTALGTITLSAYAAGNSLIGSSPRAVVTAAVATSNFVNLFASLPESGAGATLVSRINSLLKLPNGSVPIIKTQGINEFQRLAVQVIVAIQNNSLTAPATTVTNAPPVAPSPIAIPDSPSTINTSSTTTQLANGAQVLITGSGTLATRLRDPIFSSSISNKLTAAIKIFMNQSARIGLGTANISLYPGNTLNVLGGNDASDSTSVQIVPDGNCFCDVNSDLIIGGTKPLIPTPNFGTDVHQITFYSAVPRTITVTSNTTWDLSDFGSTGSDYIDYGKQIVFAGKVKLVLEPGAKIRFPRVDPANIAQSVILYFDDESSIVFQGDPLVIGMPWTGSEIMGTDCKRSKILGMGQIWLNKTARMIINKPALVGIEADFTTPKTDITVSLQRNAQVLIGTESIAGGALQIGNVYGGGSSADPENADSDYNFPNNATNTNEGFIPSTTSVDFTLVLNGNQPLFQIGRQGFFGIGAGVLNKDGAPASTSQAPNGVSGVPFSAWQLQRLYDVGNVTLNVTQGIFDHSIIADGSSGDCSMFAISKPASQFPFSKYIIQVGPNEKGVIRGGGNVYFVDKDASTVLHGDRTVTVSPHTVSLGNLAEPLSFTLSNSGTYAPLAPSITIKGRFYNVPGITSYSLYGRGVVQSSNSIPYIFAGPAEEFYTALTLNNYSDNVERYVPMNIMNSVPTITYVNGGTIVRQTLATAQLKDGTTDQASSLGYLRGARQISGAPTSFYLPTE